MDQLNSDIVNLSNLFRKAFLRISKWFSGLKKITHNREITLILRWTWHSVRFIISIIIFVFLLMKGVPVVSEQALFSKNSGPKSDSAILANQKEIEKSLTKELARLQKRMDAFTPKYPYIIINTTENKFYVYNGQTLLKEGKCSTGSYINLITNDKKSWVFKTPRGERKIQGKITSPIWRKPDWAFIEEGLPVPSPFHPSRYEYGVLGDYALSLGNGYLIHGTLYKRQLGMPVTHGCVRLNDADLDYVYHTLEVGSRVFIY